MSYHVRFSQCFPSRINLCHVNVFIFFLYVACFFFVFFVFVCDNSSVFVPWLSNILVWRRVFCILFGVVSRGLKIYVLSTFFVLQSNLTSNCSTDATCSPPSRLRAPRLAPSVGSSPERCCRLLLRRTTVCATDMVRCLCDFPVVNTWELECAVFLLWIYVRARKCLPLL